MSWITLTELYTKHAAGLRLITIHVPQYQSLQLNTGTRLRMLPYRLAVCIPPNEHYVQPAPSLIFYAYSVVFRSKVIWHYKVFDHDGCGDAHKRGALSSPQEVYVSEEIERKDETQSNPLTLPVNTDGGETVHFVSWYKPVKRKCQMTTSKTRYGLRKRS